MKSKSLSILALIVMMLLSIHISQTSHTPLDYTIQNTKPSINENLSKTPSDTIVFFNDVSQFQSFLQSHSVEKAYYNLQAVRTNISPYELQIYHHSQGYPAQLFTKYHVTGYPSESNISPQATTNTVANLTGIEPLWNMGYNGTGVTVAVMDNGINATHPALANKVVGRYYINSTGTTPCMDHGTAVAGSLAMAPDSQNTLMAGTGFGAKLVDISLGCKGLDISGDFLAGFDYVLGNGTIDIINTSFGGFAPAWDFITQKLEAAGIIVVGAAGNDGPGSQSVTTGAPGNSINAISVGSADLNGVRSTFSSIGPGKDMSVKPDLLAPGQGINTTTVDGGYGLWDGTSFSSPIVAGGIASIISGLNANGIPWNPGLIKAAALRSTEWYGNELSNGQGLINFTQMWDILSNLNVAGDSIPQIAELTPKLGPVYFMDTVPQGVVANIPMTLVTSHPNDVSFSYTGDLLGHTSVSPLSSNYSQLITVNIDTSSFATNNIIDGNITVSIGSGNDTVTANIQITVGPTVHTVIGLDLGHTYFDMYGEDGLGSRRNGELAKMAMENGFWVKNLNGEINSTILAGLDVLWMPDPANLIYANSNSLADQGFMENPLLPAEITAIVDFVHNGGNLVVNSAGFRQDIDTGDLIGLNTTQINPLTSQFDISYSTYNLTNPDGGITLNLINQSSVVGDAKQITHYGNYLDISGSAQAIAKTNGGLVSTAIYTDPNGGGRVLVSSSDRWLDNSGILGLRIPAGGENAKFALNALNWLASTTHVVKTSETITGSMISGSFKVFQNGALSSSTPTVYLYEELSKTRTQVTPTSLGTGEYSVSVSLSLEGNYRLIAEVGNDYVAWISILDSVPPIITPKSTNGTILDPGVIHTLSFELSDNSSGINQDSLYVAIDNVTVVKSLISYNANTGVLSVIFRDTDLPHDPNGTYYVLHIEVADIAGNVAKLDFYFGVGNISTSSSTTSSNPTTSTSGGSGGGGIKIDLGTAVDIVAAAIILTYIITTTYSRYKDSKKGSQ